MKTRYLAEAELSLLNGNASNGYLLDVTTNPAYQIGLLSALPTNFTTGAGDNWAGARELYSEGLHTHPDTGVQFFGINFNNFGSQTPHGYSSKAFFKTNISQASLTFNTSLGVSGVGIQFNSEVLFDQAKSDWGLVRGVVVYGVRFVNQQLRITPLMVSELITPVTINSGQRFKIPNTNSSRLRFIELTRMLPLT